jgi:hypothetical protein
VIVSEDSLRAIYFIKEMMDLPFILFNFHKSTAMRKNQLLSVLSLFLLVPASITRAQTAYLTGTVSIEQDYRNIKFNTPQGNVKVLLPGDIRSSGQGSVTLSGTVIAEPTGKTEKEKSSNLKALQKMLLSIGGKNISILPGQNHFDFSLPANLTTPVPIDIFDPGGNRATVTLKNPVILPPPTTGTLLPGQPALSTDQNVFITNSNIPVYAANNTSTLFQPTDKFYIKDARGNMTEAVKLVQSPTQTVLSSQNVPAGATTIVRESTNRTDQVNVRMADLTLSSPNTNLRKGQTSSLTVTIDPKITDKDSAEAMQIPIMSLDVKNLTPGVVDMAGGNMQVMSFPSTPGSTSASSWQATRTITGVKPGNFNISATLYPSTSISTNAANAQKKALKNAAEFNNWIAAVKKHLEDLFTGTNDQAKKDIIRNTINSLPLCSTEDELDLCKMMADNLLRTFIIPELNLATSLPAFAAYQAASNSLTNPAGTTQDFVHTDVIQNGLTYLQNASSTVNDPTIKEKITAAQQATIVLQRDYSTGNIKTLGAVLQQLNNTPFVAGQARVTANTIPSVLNADGSITAVKDGQQIDGVIGQSVEIYDDNTVVINTNNGRQTFNFNNVPANGTSLKQIVNEYYDSRYPAPNGIGCDSLVKLCKTKEALSIFWGDVYSVTNGISERRTIKGETIEKNIQSSLLITRGWEIDCCTGEFKLSLFFQAMQNGETVSVTDVLDSKSGDPYPCPVLVGCPECKEKCEKMKAVIEAAKKAAKKN